MAAVNYGELHPYGEVMTEESLEAIAQEDLQAYHRKYFRPNVAYLIAIGDITPEEAQAKASKHFGTWRRSNIPFERVLPPAMPKGMEVHFAPVEGAVQSTINVTHAIPFLQVTPMRPRLKWPTPSSVAGCSRTSHAKPT